jgi:hypothetical protein
VTVDDAVATLAASLTTIERNVLGHVRAGLTTFLRAFPADVAALDRLAAIGLITADGREVTPAGRAVLERRKVAA